MAVGERVETPSYSCTCDGKWRDSYHIFLFSSRRVAIVLGGGNGVEPEWTVFDFTLFLFLLVSSYGVSAGVVVSPLLTMCVVRGNC